MIDRDTVTQTILFEKIKEEYYGNKRSKSDAENSEY